MDNSNLMLLCNTLNSESEIRKNSDYRGNIDINDVVKVKVEQADGSQSNKTADGSSASSVQQSVAEPEAVDGNSLLNQNNNMQPGYDLGMLVTSSGSGDNLQKYPKMAPCDGINERKCNEVDVVQNGGKTCESSAPGSSFDTNLPFSDPSCFTNTSTKTANNPSKSAEGSSNNSHQPSEIGTISCANGNPFLQSDKVYREPEAKPSLESNGYQVYQAGHMSGQPDLAVHQGMAPSMESIGQQQFLEPSFPSSQACSHSHSLTDLCWTQTGQADHLFQCPVGSIPVGRMTGSQFQNGSGFVQAYVPPGYQPVVDPNSWHGQEKEQLQWVTNMMATMPPNSQQQQQQQQQQHQTQNLYDRNWSDLNDGRQQSYMYATNQNIPLDMSLTTDPPPPAVPRSELPALLHHRQAFGSEPPREMPRETIKRSRSASCLESGHGNVDIPKAKVSKDDSEKSSSGENYEISTNVHTLKPRHIVSWYIDHLIRENEEITDISKSNTWRDVNIYQSKDMYFMEPLLKKSGFPSPKFLGWMHGNFPNINIHAIDFTEGRQSNFLTDYEEQLSRKTRNEIITDTFLYFQEKRSIKMDANLV